MCGFKSLPGVVRVPCLAGTLLLLLALAGCGSTNKAATTTAASSAAAPTAATRGTAQAVKTATYNINLAHVTGSSGGANASGIVILSVKAPSDELCWSISPVKNSPPARRRRRSSPSSTPLRELPQPRGFRSVLPTSPQAVSTSPRSSSDGYRRSRRCFT
jgi:hypothetical protein